MFGLPSDDIACQGISEAAAEMAQELFGDIHKADGDAQSRLESVTSLLEALLIGLPSLTQTELQSACVDVLQMADTTDYTVAGSTLAHKLRWVVSLRLPTCLCVFASRALSSAKILAKSHKLPECTVMQQHLVAVNTCTFC